MEDRRDVVRTPHLRRHVGCRSVGEWWDGHHQAGAARSFRETGPWCVRIHVVLLPRSFRDGSVGGLLRRRITEAFAQDRPRPTMSGRAALRIRTSTQFDTEFGVPMVLMGRDAVRAEHGSYPDGDGMGAGFAPRTRLTHPVSQERAASPPELTTAGRERALAAALAARRSWATSRIRSWFCSSLSPRIHSGWKVMAGLLSAGSLGRAVTRRGVSMGVRWSLHHALYPPLTHP
jgi:hypothetical protein